MFTIDLSKLFTKKEKNICQNLDQTVWHNDMDTWYRIRQTSTNVTKHLVHTCKAKMIKFV